MTSEQPTAQHIALLDDNLFTSTRVASALRAKGHQVLVARRVEALQACDVALINLGSRTLGGLEMIAPLREQFAGARIYGFCGHLEIEIRRAAKAAGVDRLLTNESVASLQWLENPQASSDPDAV